MKRTQSPNDPRHQDDDDDDKRKPDCDKTDDTMFNIKELAGAVKALAVSVTGLGEQFRAGLATKADVLASEERILKALGERVDPSAVRDLTTASDALDKAVTENK